MAFQLVYTSVPAGLVAGRSGFSTVARHREIREALVSRIEAFSNVFDRGAQAAEDTLGLPVIHAFHHIRLGKSDYHVLSRIRDSGSDYSGRVNHIAHSLVLEPGELESLRITPAEALLALEKKGYWLDKWDGSGPRYFDDGEKEPLEGLKLTPSVKLPADHWKKATGSAATAALPCEAAAAERCHLVVEPDATPAAILHLINESLLVKDPQRRSPATLWSTSFTTHLQSSDDLASFQWSAVKKGSPMQGRLGRSKGTVIEIGPGLEAPSGDLASVAETGKIKQAPAEGAGGAAAAGATVAAPGMPLPSTRGVGIGVGEGIPLGGGKDSGDADKYEDTIAAIIGGEDGGGSGGGLKLRKLVPVAIGLVIVAIAAVLVVPWVLEKRKISSLVEQLNQKLAAAEWSDARTFYDGTIVTSGHDRAVLMKEPKAALLAAEELLFDRDLAKLPKSLAEFDSQKSNVVVWSADNREKLDKLRETAREQLEAWLKFEKQLTDTWAGLQEAMRPFEATPAQADPADSKALKALEENLSGMLKSLAENEAMYGAAKEAITRVSEARAKMVRFGEVVTQVRESKVAIPKGETLEEEVRELSLAVTPLLKLVEENDRIKLKQESDPNYYGPIDKVFKNLYTASGDFIEKALPTGMAENKPPPKPKDEPKDTQPKAVARPPALDWLPPTYLVAWQETHNYQIELSQNFGVCNFSQIVLPLVDLNPVPTSDSGWVAISSKKLRINISGQPAFQRNLTGQMLDLDGLSGGLNSEAEKIKEGFIIRFAATAAGPSKYQVVSLPLAKPAGGGAALIDLSIDDGLERTPEKDGAVVVRLRSSLSTALSKIVPGDSRMKGAKPVLRVELLPALGSMPPSKANSTERGFDFGALELFLLKARGSGEEKDKYTKALEAKMQEDAQRKAFDSLFGVTTRKGKAGNDVVVAIPGEKLYQGISDIVDRVVTNEDGSKRKVVEQRRKNLVGEMKPQAQAGAMPSIVDYLVIAVESVVNDRSRFNLRNKPTAGGEDEETARAILDEFVRTRGGWSTTGGGGYDGVRKALVSVREFAEKRPPGVAGPRKIMGRDVQKDKKGNPKTNDKGKPIPEEWHTYMNRLSERQAIINTDLFFENWVELFSEENLKSIWPYFEEFNTKQKSQIDGEIAVELTALKGKLAEIDRGEKSADQLTNDPLETLGSWHLDLEIPGPTNPNSPDPQPPYKVPLIRFTEQSSAAPAKQVPDPASVDSSVVPSSAPGPAGGAGKGKGNDPGAAAEEPDP